MTERSNYWDWPVLQEIYLEDSYVLGIRETPGQLTFQMEFVLRHGHPRYRPPRADEQYCYERGELTFRGARDAHWLERNEVRSIDATGESDLGNIDVLQCANGRFEASGDWGHVDLIADDVTVELEPNRPQ